MHDVNDCCSRISSINRVKCFIERPAAIERIQQLSEEKINHNLKAITCHYMSVHAIVACLSVIRASVNHDLITCG